VIRAYFCTRAPQRGALACTFLSGFALCAALVCAGTGAAHASTNGLAVAGKPPSSIVAGNNYTFTPAVTDSRTGRTLTFAIANKPSWASFNRGTGKLSGTPNSAQTGSYPGIVISASDGQVSSALAPFNISVTGASATRHATLSWIDPTQNSNGSSLTDFAGVRIYYGPSASNLSQLAQVAGKGVTSYTVNRLKAGTWYFGVTAYTSTGVESSLSRIVSKTIQ
jgi:Putative Ig domain